jgi:hypothetical protein
MTTEPHGAHNNERGYPPLPGFTTDEKRRHGKRPEFVSHIVARELCSKGSIERAQREPNLLKDLPVFFRPSY